MMQSNLGEEESLFKLILPEHSLLLSLGWNWVRNSGRILPTGSSLPGWWPSSFLTQLWTTCLGMAPPKVGWAFWHQSSIMTISHRYGSDLSALGDSSVEVPSFQLTLGCVKLTKPKQNKKKIKTKKLISTWSPKPEQCGLRTGAPLWLGFNSFALLPDSFEFLSLSGLPQSPEAQELLWKRMQHK